MQIQASKHPSLQACKIGVYHLPLGAATWASSLPHVSTGSLTLGPHVQEIHENRWEWMENQTSQPPCLKGWTLPCSFRGSNLILEPATSSHRFSHLDSPNHENWWTSEYLDVHLWIDKSLWKSMKANNIYANLLKRTQRSMIEDARTWERLRLAQTIIYTKIIPKIHNQLQNPKYLENTMVFEVAGGQIHSGLVFTHGSAQISTQIVKLLVLRILPGPPPKTISAPRM